MNWDHPCPNFQYILFERVNPERNEHRFYYLAYGPALEGPAIIRRWGRKGGWQQAATPLPCDSLAAGPKSGPASNGGCGAVTASCRWRLCEEKVVGKRGRNLLPFFPIGPLFFVLGSSVYKS
jgi:hypothetical protein